jgi:DNA-binding transcriptional MerR regulator
MQAERLARKPDKLYKTAEILKQSGISREMFYRYITLGLIKEAKLTAAGHRLFDHAVFRRLQLIERLKARGYTLRDLREIFPRRW